MEERMYTAADIAELKICPDWPLKRIAEVYAAHGVERVTMCDILRWEDVPAMDRFWVGIQVLSERDQRLIACDFAERVLPIYETEHPDDDRPRVCIVTARRHARGEATDAELVAARDAACDAADTAADAAWHAAAEAAWWAAKEEAWYSADAARDAAWNAALVAANTAADAAWYAALDAAAMAERAAQLDILRGYLERE